MSQTSDPVIKLRYLNSQTCIFFWEFESLSFILSYFTPSECSLNYQALKQTVADPNGVQVKEEFGTDYFIFIGIFKKNERSSANRHPLYLIYLNPPSPGVAETPLNKKAYVIFQALQENQWGESCYTFFVKNTMHEKFEEYAKTCVEIFHSSFRT